MKKGGITGTEVIGGTGERVRFRGQRGHNRSKGKRVIGRD